MNILKNAIRPAYKRLQWSKNRLFGLVPSLPVQNATHLSFTRLGSDYGGWVLVDDNQLKGSTIISCGVGEDISFDIAFAAAYGARVILVDPTPRSIRHYCAVQSALSDPNAKTNLSLIYDLHGIAVDQLILCEKALWNANTRLRFFEPPNPEHVSHSIVNFQNNYSEDTSYIEVDALTIDVLLDFYRVASPSLIKLDIEGAEVEVIIDMVSKGFRPPQVLVEYDELMVPSRKSKSRVEAAHQALTGAGYALVHREGSNFTYYFGPQSAR